MKKIICMFLILCLCSSISLAFPELLLEQQNYIVQEKTRPSLLIPASIFGYGCYYFIKNPIKEDGSNKVNPYYTYIPATILGSLALIFTIVALTPERTYLIPKLDKNGTIWFQRKIKF